MNYQELFLALIRDIANGQLNMVDTLSSIDSALNFAGIVVPEKPDGDWYDYQDALRDWCEQNAPKIGELKA